MPDQGHFATCFADSPALMDNLSEIPIATTGTWVKDGHRFSITKEDLDDIVSNFEARQNGTVVIDYEHASERPDVAKGGPIPAAAWIHNLSTKRDPETKKDTLWASVEWTAKAKEMIEGGEYRFFSPAIDWGAADKKTGRSKGATLTSGALTNHPFLEELPAIQLSDTVAKPMGKTIAAPVKAGSKRDDEKTENKTSLTDVSFDQTRSAVNEAIDEKYKRNLSYPDLCECSYIWIRELYDDYAIVDAEGKMFKIPYTMDKDQNVKLGDPEQVITQYVAASDTAVTKSEGDGDHPSSHYLVVEDPEKPTTWHLRVKDKEGKNDHGLMGAAWAALHDGYRGSKYEGPDKANALTKLKALYKSEKMKTPDKQKEESSEVTTVKQMTDAQFSAAVLKAVTLAESSPKAKKAKALCTSIRKAATPAATDKVAMSNLVSLSLKLLDDMDAYGVDGDRGEQEDLRKEAEKRAKAIDKPGDEETEVLSAKRATEGPNDVEDDDDEEDDDEDGKTSVPKFSIRKIKAEDKVGKMKHHALIGADGKMGGYLTDGAFKAHAKKLGMKMAESGESEGTLRASDRNLEAEIKNATGRPLKLTEITQFVERGISATDTQSRTKAHKLMLSAAIGEDGSISERKVRRLLADERVSQRDYADFADAFEDVDAAIRDGRLLPRQRASCIRLCLSDREGFESFIKDQPKSDRTEFSGISGRGMETDDPDKELMSEVERYQKEHGGEKDCPYKVAMTEVQRLNPGLAQRYKLAHSKLM
jgi:Mu-like prophage I protein